MTVAQGLWPASQAVIHTGARTTGSGSETVSAHPARASLRAGLARAPVCCGYARVGPASAGLGQRERTTQQRDGPASQQQARAPQAPNGAAAMAPPRVPTDSDAGCYHAVDVHVLAAVVAAAEAEEPAHAKQAHWCAVPAHWAHGQVAHLCHMTRQQRLPARPSVMSA